MRLHYRLCAAITLGLLTQPLAAQSPAPAPAPVTAPAPAFDAASFDRYVEAARRQWDVPGLAVAVVGRDRTLLLKGYGVRRTGSRALVDEGTVFNIGSSTKAFTAALLATLVDERSLAWTDRAGAKLEGISLPGENGADATIIDLLAHRTGWAPINYSLLGDIDAAEGLRRVQHVQQAGPFRAGFLYNNFGYVTAAAVAERIAGADWAQLVRTRLFQPLGMTDSVAGQEKFAAVSNAAAPHARFGGRVAPVEAFPLRMVAPAGGVYSSARDMARWVQLFLNDGRAGERQLISPQSMRAIQAMHTPIPLGSQTRSLFPSTHFTGYGLGWFMRDYRGVKLLEHGGNTTGMTAHVAFVPELDLGIVILSNRDSTSLPTALLYRAIDMALGEPVRDWSAELLALENAPAPAPAPAQTAAPAGDLPIAAFSGTYRSPVYGEARVTAAGGKLMIHLTDRVAGELKPQGGNRFMAQWRDPYLAEVGMKGPFTFDLDPAGRPQAFRLSDSVVYQRVEPGKQG
jgi:CubicO group peptidase (beta-lactamase class C family)